MGRRHIDLTGQRFSRLVALEVVGYDRWGRARWKCQCDCGNVIVTRSTSLRSEMTRSCGCLQTIFKRTHHMSHTRIYDIWVGMKKRCDNSKSSNYKNYGGRGISYHQDFATFEGFYAEMGSSYRDGLSIERINNDGNYEPGNVRWATRAEQSNNTRRSVRITHPRTGELCTYADITAEFGVSADLFKLRIDSGLSVEDACKPSRRNSSRLDLELVRDIKRALWTMTCSDVANWYNVPYHTVKNIYDQNNYRDVDI